MCKCMWGGGGGKCLSPYTACSPSFLSKSVELLSQPARLQTTTLCFNEALGRGGDAYALVYHGSRLAARMRA